MPYKWRMCEIPGWRPETREGATFTKLNVRGAGGAVEERSYLFGGLSRDLHYTIVYLTLDSSKSTHIIRLSL